MGASYPPRQEYNFAESPLRAKNVHADPNDQFRLWYEEEEAVGHGVPNQIALATSTMDGIPSLRMVLLKIFGPDGYYFFTDFSSRKSIEMDSNPHVAILSHWPRLQRQVRIEGTINRANRQLTEEYFANRPRLSRAAASVSCQSSVMDSRMDFEKKLRSLSEGDGDIPCPENWGGYCITPTLFEFWQGRTWKGTRQSPVRSCWRCMVIV